MPTTTLDGIHAKVKELNDHILPPGVKIVPFLDRSDLVHFTTHTVLHNLTEGIMLVSVILFVFLGNVARRAHRRADHSVCAAFRLHLPGPRQIPANLLSLGALDFGMVVDGAVVMIENIVRHFGHRCERARIADGDASATPRIEVQRPVFYAIAIIITAYLPIFTLQARGRPPVQAHGLDRGLRAARRAAVLDADRARCWRAIVFRKGDAEWHNPVMALLTERYRTRVRWAIEHRWVTVGVGAAGVCARRLSDGQRRDRLRISAAPGRRRDLGARHARAQHRADRRHPRGESGARDAVPRFRK